MWSDEYVLQLVEQLITAHINKDCTEYLRAICITQIPTNETFNWNTITKQSGKSPVCTAFELIW